MITIGQSPREDILLPLKEILGESFELIEAGALDDLTREDIEKIEFKKDDYLLVSRLRDGTEIRITKRFVLPLLQKSIHRLEEEGVQLSVIMCTGRFPEFDSKGLVVIPQEIIKGVLKATIQKGRLAVVYPAKEQTIKAETEFGRDGLMIYSDYLSPYREDDDLGQLAERLAQRGPDLILLNCFGFSSRVKTMVASRTGKPVIQSNALVARVLKELVI